MPDPQSALARNLLSARLMLAVFVDRGRLARRLRRASRWVCVGLAAAASAAASLPAEDERFLAGYAMAVIERDLGLEVVSIDVSGGVARVVVESLGSEPPDRVAEALSRIEGIERVEVRVAGESGARAEAEVDPDEDADEDGGLELLPRQEIFDPLIADPRQPHFAVSHRWYLHDPELGRVGGADLGETFALLGADLGADTRLEIGLLGGVFSIFDLEASSVDLVNSDFWVAPTLSLRRGALSSQLRVYHQSSHLGDEFVLRNRAERVNLSYEGVDLLVSADLHPAVRVYGGGGAIVHDEPDLDPFSAQVGLELRSPFTLLGGRLRPLAGGDFQFRQQNDWDGDIAAVAGLQLENPELSKLRMLILFEYFRGHSPNGQFFERRIETLGVGAHLHF